MLICRQPVYAAHASTGFNQWLDGELTDLTADVQRALGSNLVALVLGGAYGRGEGAVEWRGGGWAPYHNLDLHVVVHFGLGVARRLQPVRRRWCERLGIEVEFGRPMRPIDMLCLPRRLRWYELEHGHVLLSGTTPVWCERARLCSNTVPTFGCLLPPIESTRLLLNRGLGLLRSLRIVGGLEPSPRADVLRSAAYHAVLAAGDALLLSYDRYEPSYGARGRELPRLLEEHRALLGLELGSLYDQALRFKFNPDHVGEVDLDEVTTLWSATWLVIESRRCGHVWSSMSDYCNDVHVRETDHQQSWRRPFNAVENALRGEYSTVHPREWLFRRVPLMVSEPRLFDSSWQQETERLLALWHRHPI